MGNFTDRIDGPASQSGPRRAASQALKMTPLSDRLPGCGCAMPCSAARRVQGRRALFLSSCYFFFFLFSLFMISFTSHLFDFLNIKIRMHICINIVEAPRLVLYPSPCNPVIPIPVNPRRDGQTRNALCLSR
jgi:hypothetical protein